MHNKILNLKGLIREKQDILDSSKLVQGKQTEDEIRLRCGAVVSSLGTKAAALPDSQLLERNKGLAQINTEFSKILDKVTEYAGYMSELRAGDQLKEINSLVASTLEAKVDFEGNNRGEVAARDLSEEKMRGD